MVGMEEAERIKIVKGSFDSHGLAIPLEEFEPANGQTRGAVLLLHGADGMSYAGHRYRDIARTVARHGYAVFLVHYFGEAGPAVAPIRNPLHFTGWMEVVSEAITYAVGRRHAGAGGVGLLGMSLGAYLALAVASQDQRVGAVIECGGGLPDPFGLALARMPPTLILHGEDDALVPVSEAQRLERLLREQNQVCEVKIYPGQGHDFSGPALQDALQRVLAFLDRHLSYKNTRASAG